MDYYQVVFYVQMVGGGHVSWEKKKKYQKRFPTPWCVWQVVALDLITYTDIFQGAWTP